MTNPDTQTLASSTRRRYNDQIRTGAVLATTSVRVIADALERAGAPNPQGCATRSPADRCRPSSPQDGPDQFDQTGENKNATPILMQVQSGMVKQVFPADKTPRRSPSTRRLQGPVTTPADGTRCPRRRRGHRDRRGVPRGRPDVPRPVPCGVACGSRSDHLRLVVLALVLAYVGSGSGVVVMQAVPPAS